jgi:hypothetical protein
VLTRIYRCKNVKIRFLSENATVQINEAEGIQLLQNFQPLILLLEVGDAKTALSVLSQIPEFAFIVTSGYETSETRKQTYVDELQSIVNDLFD